MFPFWVSLLILSMPYTAKYTVNSSIVNKWKLVLIGDYVLNFPSYLYDRQLRFDSL